jgi:hypothetical protein
MAACWVNPPRLVAACKAARDPYATFAWALIAEHQNHNSMAATTYSITSARSRIEGGTVRPSAFAVLRLTAISNFVGN